jgi:hypothetical protein
MSVFENEKKKKSHHCGIHNNNDARNSAFHITKREKKLFLGSNLKEKELEELLG